MCLPLLTARISSSLPLNHAAAELAASHGLCLSPCNHNGHATNGGPCAFLLKALTPVVAITTANAGPLLSATANTQHPMNLLAASLHCHCKLKACLAPAGARDGAVPRTGGAVCTDF